MKAVAALIRREILERRMVLAAAAFAAIMPFLVPLARGLQGAAAREARESLTAIVAAGFAVVLAFALGWSAISRDLADRRFGFYLSRPISGFALWAGKLGAAWLLALAAGAVVWLPSWAASRGTTLLADLPPWWVWGLLGGTAILVVLAHAAAIALRSRSALLIVDFTVLILTSAASLWFARFLLRRSAMWPLRAGLAALAAMLVLGLLGGGLVAITRGRADIRSAHRALSPWIWVSLAGGLALYGGLTAWVLSARPADLFLARVLPAPSGKWIAVSGQARHIPAGFLLNTESGRYLPAGCVRPGAHAWELPSFSADGGTAAWFEPAEFGEPYELVTVALASERARPHRTGFTPTFLPANLELSPDGRRATLLGSGRVEIVDSASGKLVVSARLSDVDVVLAGRFLGPDHFLAAIWGSRRLDLFDLDIPARRLAPRATIPDLEGWYTFTVDSSGARVIIREKAGKRVRLFDARTGNPIATLAEGPPQHSSWAFFLADGRIGYLTSNENRGSLRLFAADGGPLRTIEVPGNSTLPGGEVAPGRVVFAAQSVLYLADLDSGTVRRVADGLHPVLWFATWSQPAAPGSDATKLFYSTADEVRSLVRFDPLTGDRRVILKGRKES